MVSEKVFPAVICCGRDGRPRDVVLMNAKAVSKSREHGVPWILHRETGRLLPYASAERLESLEERDGWFLLTVTPPAAESSETDVEQRVAETAEDAASEGSATAGSATAGVVTGDPGEDRAVPEAQRHRPGDDAGPVSFEVLRRVAATIAQRKKSLPEGSYTTYLFTQGIGKIRKKTGEEAIELLLAETPEELAAEAADLLYHLTVLLEATGVGFTPVLEALQKRE